MSRFRVRQQYRGRDKVDHLEGEVVQIEGRLLGLMAEGSRACQQVHQKVERAAMAGMLDLADVLESVHDRLDDRPLTQEQLVGQAEQTVTHVLAQLGDELPQAQ
jgi:hypothetical protein